MAGSAVAPLAHSPSSEDGLIALGGQAGALLTPRWEAPPLTNTHTTPHRVNNMSARPHDKKGAAGESEQEAYLLG